MTLTLETGGDGIMSARFFLVPQFAEPVIAVHEVAGYQSHLDRILPFGIELFARTDFFGAVGIFAFLAVFLHPGEGAFILFSVIDFIAHTVREYRHINYFHTHTEIVFKKRLIDDRPGNAHGATPHGEVGFSFHHRHGQTGLSKAQEFFFDIGGNGGIARILHITAIDSKGGKSLLRVSGKNGGEIYSTGALGSIESPDRLRPKRFHVHGFGAVAPARGHGQRYTDVFGIKFFGTCGGFGNPADAGVGDHAFNGFPVRVFQRRAD